MAFTWRKLSLFVKKSTWDLLIPDIIDKPFALAKNFYEAFLVAAAEDQEELLQEAQQLTAPEKLDMIVQEVIAGLSQQEGGVAPPGANVQTITQRLIQALREAGLACQHGENSSEALRRSLNKTILAGAGKQIAPHALSPEQRSVGRLLVSSVLAGGAVSADRVLRFGSQVLPKIPDYEALRLLGSGGFADVYLMRHHPSRELRAVKVIHTVDDPRRLLRELDTLRKVRDEPHLVSYRADGQVNGTPWIAMEYLGDASLAQVLKVPPARPTPEQAMLLGEQILRGLAALHSRGIIHRDLKPDNIMIDDQFRLRLIDFGLAKPIHGMGEKATQITRTAAVVGTPFYMSLEQLRGKGDLTPAADLWSYGVVFHELLTGSVPFQGASFVDVALSISTEKVNLQQDNIPLEVRPFLGRCFEREASGRYQDAGTALQEFLQPATAARRRLRHERYRPKWIPILEKQLLEQFAAEHHGNIPEDAAATFSSFAGGHGIPDIDETRVVDILPPIFAEQRKVEVAEAEITTRKQRLQQQTLSLSPVQIQQLSTELIQLQGRVDQAREGVAREVRRLLADEVRNWEDVQRQESQQAARIERERQEAAQRIEEQKRAALAAALQQQQAQAKAQRIEKELADREEERADWLNTNDKASRSSRGYEQFLLRWPNGPHVSDARRKMTKLQRREKREAAYRLRLICVSLFAGAGAILGGLLVGLNGGGIAGTFVGIIGGAIAGLYAVVKIYEGED